MSESIESIIESAVEEVDEIDLSEPYPEDRIHEIADGSVPVYNSTIMEVASNDYGIMLDEPEIGPAFDGEATPINIAAANIYERVNAACFERLYERQQEDEEIADDWDWAIELDEEFDRLAEIEAEAKELTTAASRMWHFDQTFAQIERQLRTA